MEIRNQQLYIHLIKIYHLLANLICNDIAIYKSICLYFRKLHNYLSKCLLLLAESLSIDKIVINLT